MGTVSEYIQKNWQKTIRLTTCKGHGMVTMPKPFSSPSIEPMFEDFYYWDTYFINIGLLTDGLIEQAKNNLENIAFFIRHMGYMPNASHLHYTSQPPLFARAVYDYWKRTGDGYVIYEYLDAILIEYKFFMSDRMTKIGLNQYGCVNFIKAELDRHYDYFSQRVGIYKKSQAKQIAFVKNMFAVCESGWDCAPWCDTDKEKFAMHKYVQVTLNSLLFDMEQKVAEMYRAIGQVDHAKQFEDFAQRRKLRMDKYMLNKENGLYCNYNLQGKYFSSVLCTASFYPYVVGLTNDVEPLKTLLKKLELEYGISTCEYRGEQEYLQWDYPLMWAPEMYFAYQALKNTGLIDDAKRIANKYLQTVERNYQQTGILWEKYNAKTGEVGSAKESEEHPMLGWTAAIYQYFYKELNA